MASHCRDPSRTAGHAPSSTNGALKCWGDNEYGALGLGDLISRGKESSQTGDGLRAINLGTGRTAKAVAAGGYYHACAIVDDGRVKCWGNNEYGQLGVADKEARGDEPNEMGDALPFVDLGNGRTATAVVTTAYNTCALLDNGSVKCWGQSGGNGLGESGGYRGDEPNEMGDALPAVKLGTNVTAKAIVGGYSFVCALLNSGAVKCWGDNHLGQLGQGDTVERGRDANFMGDNLPPVLLGSGRTARAIAAGAWHACALLDNGEVKCWGHNESGELGLGDKKDRGNFPGQMGDALPAVDLGTK